MNIQVGQKVKAKSDRVLEFAGHDPFVLWKRDQVLWVQGVFQNSPGSHRDLMICLDNENFENVPESIAHELFEMVE